MFLQLLDDDFSLKHSHRSADDIIGSFFCGNKFVDDWLIFYDCMYGIIKAWNRLCYHTSFSIVGRRYDEFIISSSL